MPANVSMLLTRAAARHNRTARGLYQRVGMADDRAIGTRDAHTHSRAMKMRARHLLSSPRHSMRDAVFLRVTTTPRFDRSNGIASCPA
jgi:hypothetical protein